MVKNTLKNKKYGRGGGKNKTVKKIKRGGEIPDLLNKTQFVTNDKFIKNELLKLNIKQSKAYQDKRDDFYFFIENTDLCKGNDSMNESIKQNITNTEKTFIFINNGYAVSGLLIFWIDNDGIQLESICVPDKSIPGTGTFLLSLLKNLSDNINKILLVTSANNLSDKFYEKNGLSKRSTNNYEYKYLPTTIFDIGKMVVNTKI